MDGIKTNPKENNVTSASGLQSKFGWGFPKANAMIMRLEEDGVVSGLDGNKRSVLVKKSENN